MSGAGPTGKVYPLKDNQARAVDPSQSVWLSASAGTGKTQVLSARVLRLLLRKGVDPSQILCLTFTKAGAAEMATRVNEVLANWVRMPADALAADMEAIGAPTDPDTRELARSLFASVLDTPGGGLRIDTIHAFSQWLLAAFPDEAGLMPGSRAMEDRDREVLSHQVLADMLVDWERTGETDLLGHLGGMTLRMGPDGVRSWMMRCADHRSAWEGKGAWQESDIGSRTRVLLGLPSDATRDGLSQLCSDDRFDVAALRICLAEYEGWNAKGGREAAAVIPPFLSADAEGRFAQLNTLEAALFFKNGNPRLPKAAGDAVRDASARVQDSVNTIRQQQALFDLVDLLVPALTIGRRFALRWEAAKAREGLIDFDDQIRRAADLLTNDAMSDWIRYKLDRRFDHILIDEAQDTNEAQWSIIRALTDDFFSGRGQRDDRLRTIFVVGDYKQAIFRFQGTSPENFRIARDYFADAMATARSNALAIGERTSVGELQDLGLGRSYRTSQPVLDIVDDAIAAIGPAEFGLADGAGKHEGFDRPGLVRLWDPIGAAPEADDIASASSDYEETGDHLTQPEFEMADRIADQVRGWMRDGFPLMKDGGRRAGPGDVMVLVRKRRDLAGLIVARLHARNVPVAGVDRLRLGAPLAVKDLMAALRFAAQPLDDLSLANLLVGPLVGWTQEQLLQHGYRDPKTRLWDHLRKAEHPEAAATADRLRDLLRLADIESPQALLHWLLVGPWQGKRKLMARLGREAADPIDELLNAAASFAAAHVVSLQGFIRWFDAGDSELKREAEGAGGQVRVMTVHGSKGLQAPIVILADATGNPDTSPTRGLALPDMTGTAIPLPPLRSAERVGPIADADEVQSREEREEHWRLLYVAMTRAEEALFIGGALTKREQEPAPDSWYAQLAPLFEGDGQPDPIWGSSHTRGSQAPDQPALAEIQSGTLPDLPTWATTPIGPEPVPPRPLAPSSAGDEQGADPPLPADRAKDAARRGILLHGLLERLPEVDAAQRRELGAGWLARQAADVPEHERDEMLASALGVLETPSFADLFAPGALAEVPLAATVNKVVVAGIADRLLVTDKKVLVVDYKTARRPPTSAEAIPAGIVRQMAAYAAALQVIFPDRPVEAAVLYTQTPALFVIPDAVLAENGPRLQPEQESFAASPVE
ncbi:ATP-dependent helicase/nuclease subunit [Alteripontixanthobacter maritimus]|uniref:DNA 3'-5' helicase n=1 Tax=Alteripontixanthobacter maritimus TaxID=2161824 RepID=A0A369Q809_9SPHN|nr:double-strand break repair helicase AddA [Alteripontixanthobacter maritimus]RDC59665.1 ATP-dependent helicase/nuclease subunit [Alteripontixanthobacter maritimus]